MMLSTAQFHQNPNAILVILILSFSRHVAAIRRSEIKESTTKSNVLLSFEKANPPEALIKGSDDQYISRYIKIADDR